MTLRECSISSGCTVKEAKLVLDANWRWIHTTEGYTNCYTGNQFDTEICSDPDSCALNCAVEAVDADQYEQTYGITSIPGGVKLDFVTGSNVGSRLFMMDDDGESYKMFKLKNREFALDIDVSNVECGMNGAMYFIEMAADGGKGIGNNDAGAKYGTGYCDAQCPHDIKFVDGKANADWEANTKDFSGNMGQGQYGACCAEMDIWEANNMANAYTPHPCNIDTPGQYACEGTECGDNEAGERYQGLCDKDGCDINPFRMGNVTFYGKGPEFTINTLKPMTVVTQFLTHDGTDTGDLSEIRRFYVQDGKVVHSPVIKILPGERDSITDEFCQDSKVLFDNTDDFTAKGGNAQMGRSLDRGHVAAFSLWDDVEVNMMWLDSSYPTDKPSTDPGVKRGECPGGDESSPESVRRKYGSTGYVSFANAAVGEIGTLFGVSPAMPTITATTSSTSASIGDFEPVNGGTGQACRGANINDNSASYYTAHSNVATIDICKSKCMDSADCQGIEYSASMKRCEVWTRAQGIEATKPFSGFTCLRYTGGVPVSTSTSVPTGDFEPVNGGTGQACRGANINDNSASYYTAHSNVATIDNCKSKCMDSADCQGIEYSASMKRCEVWTRAQGIEATKPFSGFTCLRYTSGVPVSTSTSVPTGDFEPVNGGTGQACRGANINDNSASYYTVHSNVATIDICKSKCMDSADCQGIEYSASMKRCEVWTRAQGIEATKPFSGFTCLRLGSSPSTSLPTTTTATAASTTAGSSVTATAGPSTSSMPSLTGNPFEGQAWFVNPSYRELLAGSIEQTTGSVQETLRSMQNVPSAFWIDVKSKIYKGQGHEDHNTVEGILEEAAACSPPSLVVLIVYDLPNRDCFALASNGEICCHYGEDVGRTKCNMSTTGSNRGFYAEFPGENCADGLKEYKEEYIDPFAEVVSRFKGQVPVVLVIEPDSLPNLVTNMADKRPNDFRGCHQETKTAYEEGIKYAVERFSTTGASLYVDAGHGGWLGWANPEDDKARGFADIISSMDISDHIRGFATNVANYQPLGDLVCPEPDTCRGGKSDDPCCAEDPCGLQAEWNWAHNELNYVGVLDNRMQAAMPGFKPHFLVDTGRNGVPAARTDCATWCNPRNVGIGRAPTIATADPRIDAYFWLKTPGESDGCTEQLPDGSSCPRFDSECSSDGSIGSNAGEPRAPEAGLWFHYQIAMLAENAAMGDLSAFQQEGSCGNASSFPPRTTMTTSMVATSLEASTSVTTPAGCAQIWKQCGGKDHQGPFCCEEGLTCIYGGEYYSQCKQNDALLQKSRSRRHAFLGTAFLQEQARTAKTSQGRNGEL
eukprot:CAMPEP_0197705576 /NCGR_PEP_ID=MMETSP1338-20131121/126511_1 /TAXON_ID=43686 ORGANISM="Pelagodinium beii, Strain RCC1491" /NCGR_SAMPLE_ID=MMETSP1338 /ASSEMBLY_ACC=CAM_ASM_000754 /LENGTH=1321 /DNA_ID=CAMNT_0043289485 /DNA_START=186 /DNA_END=4151 /DNA_ORIENTATION=-